MNILKLSQSAIIILSGLYLISCGSDGSSGGVKLVDLDISANANIDAGSSYENSKTDISIAYSSIPLVGDVLSDAIAYVDIDDDTDTDVFMATGEYLLEGEIDSQLFINNGANSFSLNTALFNGDAPQATHARKSIVADFNNDELNDIFVFDHGYDANPFPGNYPKLIIQGDSELTWEKIKLQKGFHHGGAAADIDNDGDIDIFVGGFEPFFLINDGDANFTMAKDRFDASIDKVFSAELIDVDSDGFIDLLVGAHEQDGDKSSIYWGSSKGSYSKNLRTVLPEFKNYGTVLDFEAEDLDGDDERDIVVNRTGGGNENFYIGRKIQIVKNNGDRTFSDVTASKVPNPGSSSDGWFPWQRAQDIDNDGDIDIFSDDRGDGVVYKNNGSGSFTLSTFAGTLTTNIPANLSE